MIRQHNNVRTFHECRDRESASSALAKRLAQVLKFAIRTKGQATLVVSGGTSPVQLFSLLSEVPLAWNQVSILVSDERIVPADHADRNERMIKEALLKNEAANANFISLIDNLKDDALNTHASQVLDKINYPIDAVVLGMGTDGHTASLFPDSPTIDSDLSSEAACVVQEVPKLGRKRLTLTPSTLLNANEIDLLFFGDDKRSVFERAMKEGEMAEYPVRSVIHQDQVPLNSYWAP